MIELLSSPLQEARRAHAAERERKELEEATRYVAEQASSPLTPAELDRRTRQYVAERQKRIDRFVDYMRTKRRVLLEQICPKS